MQHTLSFPPSESPEAESNPTFNVLIAYEDFESGKHAKQTYDFLVENLGRDCHLTNQMWKFDVLGIPKLREIAVRDATSADIIIVSCQGNELPDYVAKWVESWLMEGTNALALVALFEQHEPSATVNPAVKDYLADVAKRGKMEFFAQPGDLPGHNRCGTALHVPLRSSIVDRSASDISGVFNRDASTPRWGLNE
ncbi:MAG TPA: hypothetical protein VKY92_19680 [Verrucomicrobiae bacterium]|jgi:hypothetical protein|nr:hypothetical protein [Verrucomicrobiae bacterium]